MSSIKKRKSGCQNSPQLGMLTKINSHFFPELNRPVIQEFIYLNDEIDTDNCGSAVGRILDLNQPRVEQMEDDEGVWFEPSRVDVINLLITTPGGDMSGAFALANVMRGSKIPIRTIALGEAVSAGFCLLIAGHQRVVTPYTTLMSHIFSTGVDGNYHEIKNAMQEIHRYNTKMVDFYADCTKLDPKLIRRKFLGKDDVYISHQDAIKYNMVDLISGLE